MQETKEKLSVRLASLQQEVDGLKATAAKEATAWGERMQSEMAQQRKQNEQLRVRMQHEQQAVRLEREQAQSQLIVLSRQHQLALASSNAEQKALQAAVLEKDKALQSLAEESRVSVEASAAEVHLIDVRLVKVCTVVQMAWLSASA